MISDLIWRRRLGDMKSLLAADRRLLLSGAIEDLAKLDPRRLAAEEKLRDMPRDVAQRERRRLRELRRMARRNQKLLQAYLEGARAAATRLTDLNQAGGEFGAYRRDGSRIMSPTGRSTRRVRA